MKTCLVDTQTKQLDSTARLQALSAAELAAYHCRAGRLAKRRTFSLFRILYLTSIVWIDSFAQAQVPINWMPGPHNITGDNDVAISGALFYAANCGTNTATTIVSAGTPVTFSAFPTNSSALSYTGPSGNYTLASTTPINGGSFFGSGPGTPFGSLSSSYQALLGSASFDANAPISAPLTLTLQNLTHGTTYLVQLWVNQSAQSSPVFESVQPTVTQPPYALEFNTTPPSEGMGQYIIGTFTTGSLPSDPTSEAITLTGTGSLTILNAFQVRQVPEPSTLAITTSGLSLLLAVMRFRRLS